VKGVLAQRLVRRTCATCAGEGCSACDGTGFHGRLALVEVLIANPEFERCVADGAPTERIADVARAGGMRSLWKSGDAHAAAARTTLEEVGRVATPEEPSAPPRTVKEEPVNAAPLGDAMFDLRDDLDLVLARRRQQTERRSFPVMTKIEVGTVDVFVIHESPAGWRVLALQRALDTRCPTAWEPVHGHIEPGEEPQDAAIREVREETGLQVERLYVVRVQPFYLRKRQAVEMAIVFAAFVRDARIATSLEHQQHAWLTVDEALTRFAFPGERASLREIVELLSTGDAGPVDDVMRVF
jgi:8-oxo-dGTP pyrophosphatase MutT (NUDIX family)